MSASPDDGFLPPLDKIFARETSVLSWRAVKKCLSLARHASDVADLEKFFKDERNQTTLLKALSPFDRPSEASKQELETRTAPIHVSTTKGSDQDVEQLKKDALWLTAQLDIDEISGLRFALLEWQERCADMVLGNLQPEKSNEGKDTTTPSDVVRHNRLLRIFLEEKSAIRSVCAMLAGIDAGAKVLSTRFGHEPWLESIAESLRTSRSGKRGYLAACVADVSALVDLLEDNKTWPKCFQVDFALHEAYLCALLQDTASTLRQAIIHVFYTSSATTSEDVLSWFRLMRSTTYFANFHPSSPHQAYICEIVQALVALLSAAILSLREALAELEKIRRQDTGQSTGKSYINDDAAIRELNLLMFDAATQNTTIAAPAIYTWSILGMYIRDCAREEQEELRRIDDEHDAAGRHGSVSRRPSAVELKYDSLQDMNLGEARDDPPSHLARQAADDLGVYTVIGTLSSILTETFATPLEATLSETCRNILYDLVRESLPLVSYGEDVIGATLAVLAPLEQDSSAVIVGPLADRFLHDQTFQNHILQQAVSRYPYELTPFLQLMSAASEGDTVDHSNKTIDILTRMKSMTLTLPDDFRGYALEHEEEGANAFRLLEDLPLFVTRSTGKALTVASENNTQMIAFGEDSDVTCIPRGTQGVILRDSRPFIVQLQHEHNAFHYLGLLLETYLDRAVYSVAPPAPPVDGPVCLEIIHLLSRLLHRNARADDTAHLLSQLAQSLPEGLDIIAVIADILDIELLFFSDQTGKQKSTELLVSCIDFLHGIQRHQPERVWSYLSQGSLLSDSLGGSLFGSVVSNSRENYLSFAHAVARLYKSMLDDALRGVVQRKKLPQHSSRSRRFDSPLTDTIETSERTIAAVLAGYTRFALEILQRLAADECFGNAMASTTTAYLLSSFHQALVSAYGVEGGQTPSTGLSNAIKPAAQMIISTFLDGEQSLTLLIGPVRAAAQLHAAHLPSSQYVDVRTAADTSLQLMVLLIRISEQQDKSPSTLSRSLTIMMGTFAEAYAAQASLRADIAELLMVMTAALSMTDGEPVSLFGQLQPSQGQNFLQLLTELDQPFRDVKTECVLWDLFSAASEHGQLWFSMYLLTGILPRDRLKSKDKPNGQTVLNKALDALVDIKDMEPERALAMTNFVSKAQKLWIWATSLVRSHTDFLQSALLWLRELKPVARVASQADELLGAREYTLAAALCDILAVGIHAGAETGDKSLIKLVIPSLGFLAANAPRIDSYNKPLHSTLQRNLANRFSNLDINDFKRTPVNPASIGRSYFYDLEMAHRALCHDGSWSGSGKKGNSGFEEEFARANINWSLVDASKALLNNWQRLAVTLANSESGNSDLTGVLLTTIETCLDASLDADLGAPDMSAIMQTRSDLVFGLLSQLASVGVEASRSKVILDKAWSVVKASPVDFDVATATSDLSYYRSLLRNLLLSLNLSNSTSKAQGPRTGSNQAIMKIDYETGGILVEIMTRTVTTGFRALCSNLHGDISTSTPDDFALVTALLQAVLASGEARHFHPQLADAIVFSATARSASSLFSWSDTLANLTDDEPVYGELAAIFLATLSQIPQVAEHLALEGILARLSSAGISDLFRQADGKGPFDQPAAMFTIWTDAFLPICINMLEAIGPPVASEISSFLNSFPQQLARAEKALVNASPGPREPRAGAVTLGLLTEARDLILVAQVLQASIRLGAAEGIASSDVEELKYSISNVMDDIEALTKSARSLRDRLVPSNAREAALFANKKVGGSDNALEAAVVRAIEQTKALVAE